MLLSTQSASFRSGGHVRISQGQFSYQYGALGQDETPQRPPSLQLPLLVLLACLALPGACEIYVGSGSLDLPCEEPLAQWLLADGAASLALLALASLLCCRLFGAPGDQELQRTEVQEEMGGGTAVAHYQECTKRLTACEQRLLGLLPYAAALPAMLLLVGWVQGISLCCCWPCCLGIFGAALAPGTPRRASPER
mmetsp:Transcript_80744/g.250631  ORF Transcript_80744/g.250631 Transcript_80744/m.250631 type:complete len:195 (-) Transcript_80744:86-670(-)